MRNGPSPVLETEMFNVSDRIASQGERSDIRQVGGQFKIKPTAGHLR
jgi:hypothetical protein